MDSETPIQVIVYSDYVCPFCYMAKSSLDIARQKLALDITWRAFELRPAGSPPMDPSYKAMIEANWPRVVAMGQEYGIEVNDPRLEAGGLLRQAPTLTRLSP